MGSRFNITMVGTGYVGLVTGACFSEFNANVVCVDIDSNKIDNLKKGILPIYENGLKDIVVRNMEAGRLTFTTNLQSVLDDTDILFSTVGTPPLEDGSADLSYTLQVAKDVGRYINNYILFVTKSTVPVGTAKKVRETIQNELDKRGVNVEFDVASNPEFLKEGVAVNDFLSPDRIVIGVDTYKAKKILSSLYSSFMLNEDRLIVTDILSAEMIKYASNSMLATRISFMNEIANLCDLVGADINMVRQGIGSDTRIGNKFLYAGIGYGGSCFPKDVRALVETAESKGYKMEILKAVDRVNEKQKSKLFKKLYEYYEGNLEGKIITVWGLSFKPETDDLREAPSIILVKQLLGAGCIVHVADPVAMEQFKTIWGDKVRYYEDSHHATLGADALMLVTEWKEYRNPNWKQLKFNMNTPLILDGRNIYDGKSLMSMGFNYSGIGSNNLNK